jgi:uncharacterized protein with GYD domain
VDEFWTMGAYDAVVVLEAPNDETMSAFILKIGSLGNVKGQTLRAFRRNEMEDLLAKIKYLSLRASRERSEFRAISEPARA